MQKSFVSFVSCLSFLSSPKETKQRKVRNVFEESNDEVIREKESNPQNIPHEEVFRGMQIL